MVTCALYALLRILHGVAIVGTRLIRLAVYHTRIGMHIQVIFILIRKEGINRLFIDSQWRVDTTNAPSSHLGILNIIHIPQIRLSAS